MLKIIAFLFNLALFLCILVFVFIIVNYKVITLSTKHLIFTDAKKLPDYSVTLVPGSGDSVNNVYFKERMNASAELYHLKKIEKIIVSGRDDFRNLDEPQSMKTALIERGIPSEIIIKDYGARRTINSVDQLKYQLKEDSVIIVSQKAHLERALFLSKVKGLHVAGYPAKEYLHVKYRKFYQHREVLARIKCTYDCLKYILTK